MGRQIERRPADFSPLREDIPENLAEHKHVHVFAASFFKNRYAVSWCIPGKIRSGNLQKIISSIFFVLSTVVAKGLRHIYPETHPGGPVGNHVVRRRLFCGSGNKHGAHSPKIAQESPRG
jgi:hypothetical protein